MTKNRIKPPMMVEKMEASRNRVLRTAVVDGLHAVAQDKGMQGETTSIAMMMQRSQMTILVMKMTKRKTKKTKIKNFHLLLNA